MVASLMRGVSHLRPGAGGGAGPVRFGRLGSRSHGAHHHERRGRWWSLPGGSLSGLTGAGGTWAGGGCQGAPGALLGTPGGHWYRKAGEDLGRVLSITGGVDVDRPHVTAHGTADLGGVGLEVVVGGHRPGVQRAPHWPVTSTRTSPNAGSRPTGVAVTYGSVRASSRAASAASSRVMPAPASSRWSIAATIGSAKASARRRPTVHVAGGSSAYLRARSPAAATTWRTSRGARNRRSSPGSRASS